jgi:hypothetical protein
MPDDEERCLNFLNAPFQFSNPKINSFSGSGEKKYCNTWAGKYLFELYN